MPRRTRHRRRADAGEWAEARKAEAAFARKLRSLARRCGELASTIFDSEDFQSSAQRLSYQLQNYGRTITPWAQALAKRMVEEVARRDRRIWAKRGKAIGRALHHEIENAPTGWALQQSIAATASLITSLPLEAAVRVNDIAIKAMVSSQRADVLAQEILNTGHVTKSRANLIARTQTSTCASELVKVRAEHLGSEGYIWRTAQDADVRERHKHLEGTFHRWDTPPIAGERGERAHAGQIYNCRCWPEVVLPDETV
jgi:SPP1 gp7 family putative phage head morphogenesis protein